MPRADRGAAAGSGAVFAARAPVNRGERCRDRRLALGTDAQVENVFEVPGSVFTSGRPVRPSHRKEKEL